MTAEEIAKRNLCIEVAFNCLMREAGKQSLPIARPMGLMYLPTQQLTTDFQTACNNILDAIVSR